MVEAKYWNRSNEAQKRNCSRVVILFFFKKTVFRLGVFVVVITLKWLKYVRLTEQIWRIEFKKKKYSHENYSHTATHNFIKTRKQHQSRIAMQWAKGNEKRATAATTWKKPQRTNTSHWNKWMNEWKYIKWRRRKKRKNERNQSEREREKKNL